MFSKRTSFAKRASAIAPLAMMACARAQATEEEDRLLLAIVKPTVTSTGNGTATVSFKTGPNLVSNDYTVSCYERNLTVPTTSCLAIEESGVSPAGDVVTGSLPRVLSTVTNTVTGLEGETSYDCFVNVYGVAGNEECKYVGRADLGCTAPGAPEVDTVDTVGFIDDFAFNVTGTAGLSSNPPVADGTANQLGVACVPAGDACPVEAAVDIAYGATFDGIVSTLPDGVTPLSLDTAYDCYALQANSCDETDVLCSDPVEYTAQCVAPGPMTVVDITPAFNIIADALTLAIDSTLGANSVPPVADGTSSQVGAACVAVGDGCPTNITLEAPYFSGAAYTTTVLTLADGTTPFAPNTAYDCYSVIKNGCDDSVVCSAPVEGVTLFAAPTAVTAGSTLTPGEIEVTVTKDPANGDGNAILYQVGCTTSAMSTSDDCPSEIQLWADYGDTPLVIDGLLNGTDYQCCVRGTAVWDGVPQVEYTGPTTPPTTTTGGGK